MTLITHGGRQNLSQHLCICFFLLTFSASDFNIQKKKLTKSCSLFNNVILKVAQFAFGKKYPLLTSKNEFALPPHRTVQLTLSGKISEYVYSYLLNFLILWYRKIFSSSLSCTFRRITVHARMAKTNKYRFFWTTMAQQPSLEFTIRSRVVEQFSEWFNLLVESKKTKGTWGSKGPNSSLHSYHERVYHVSGRVGRLRFHWQ